MEQQWRHIPGWEGIYEVSDDGAVRSIPRTVHFADGRVRHFPGQARATYADGFGYRKVTLTAGQRCERTHIHVLVAAAWIGPRPAGMHVCHTDGDHLNNRCNNLRYDTPAGNVADTARHGRFNPRKRLSEADVAAIRELRGKAPLLDVAAQFGASKTHICNIQRGNRRAKGLPLAAAGFECYRYRKD